jgi:hypothetical protein
MLPARRVNQQVLESDSGPLDPLKAAMEAFVSAPDAMRWRIVAQVPIPPAGQLSAGTLTIMLVGEPLAGMILCFDRGSFRECKRLRPDGVHLCSISGQRQSSMPPMVDSLVGLNNFVDATIAVVDRIQGGGE